MYFHGHVFKHHERLLQLLQACKTLPSLRRTKPLHALTITMGSVPNQPIFPYNNIISQYVSVGELLVARKLFDKMPQRNVVSYNTIISAYSRFGDVEEALNLFSEMRGCGFRPTQFTLGGLLSCMALDLYHSVQLQGLVIKNGLFDANAFVGTALLGLFGRHGCVEEAVLAFEDMPLKSLVTWNSMLSLFGHNGFVEKCMSLFRELMRTEIALSETYCLAEKIFEMVPIQDVVSWNTIIAAVAKSERPGKALELFLDMCISGILPSQATFVSVINSCTSLGISMYGEFIHAKTIRNSFESDVYVGSALVDFYAKCDKLEAAHFCFDEIYEKNVVSWNALILGYSTKCSSTSIYLLQEMLRLGYRPNEFSFSAVLRSSLALELRQLHGLTIRMGYLNNEYVSSYLVTSYAKNGLLSDALIFVTASNNPLPVVSSNIIAGIYNRSGQYNETLKLLSLLEEPDIVSWNIVLAACARNNYQKEAFELFKHMHMTDFNRCDTFVCNVLIDMYGKCGSVESSVKIFNKMTNRNLITWTALISVLGLNGYAHEALGRFREMELLGFKPDRIALIAVLTACKHGGLVKEGMELFERMRRSYGVEPEMDHYHCVVDLLANYGHSREAEKIIASMPFPPDAIVWRSFLAGCMRQGTTKDQPVGHENLDQHNRYISLGD
uniref:Pentacotripeptide-repeat region of PRORP domain-containing protein n=1 Tax=Fagus sylvatica TaxID=28930 RepID=A0A2N9ED28_FAGSY